jgi:putative phage-type endonuclease
MKIIDVSQRTEEWKEFRSLGVGASTISSLIPKGSKWEDFRSPYESKYGAYMLKKGLKTFSKESLEIMEKGVIFEDDARELYEKLTGSTLLPICAIDDTYDFIRVSFDGLGLEDNIPREIKVPFNKFFFLRIKEEHTKNNGLIGKYYRYYVPQVQMQMYVSGATKSEIVVYKPAEDGFREEMVVFTVERNDEMIRDLISYAYDFWNNHILTDIPPEMDPEMDFIDIPEKYANDIFKLYQMKRVEENLKKLYEKAKENTEALSRTILSEFDGYPKIKGFGLSVEEKVRKGSIDYKAMCEFLLENYSGDVEELNARFRKTGSLYITTKFIESELTQALPEFNII